MDYYLCKVVFDSGEINKSGKAIVSKTQILVEGTSPTDVEATIHQHLSDSINDFEVTGITKSGIESVYQIRDRVEKKGKPKIETEL